MTSTIANVIRGNGQRRRAKGQIPRRGDRVGFLLRFVPQWLGCRRGSAEPTVRIYESLNQRFPHLRDNVREYWETHPCGVRAGKSVSDRVRFFEEIDDFRYRHSPFIPSFARFDGAKDKRVLEIGLGSGSDFMRWVRGGAAATGRDLTEASVKLVKERLSLDGAFADVAVGDAENLEFSENVFDIVYSYAVLHYTPDTAKAIAEVYRVLKPGGVARVMIYHARGLGPFYVWVRFALFGLQPWKTVRETMYFHNESLGTKVFTRREARALFAGFRNVRIRTVIDAEDIGDFELSPRYRQDWLIRFGHRVVSLLRHVGPLIPSMLGTAMLIEAQK